MCMIDDSDAIGMLQLFRPRQSSSESACDLSNLTVSPDGSGVLFKKFSVDTGLACLHSVKVNAKKAAAHVAAWAKFWEEFYVFAAIYPDPVDSDFTNFSVPPGVHRPGMYAEKGGGSYPPNEKADILEMMRQYVEHLQSVKEVTLYELNLMSNKFWISLRDAHTVVKNSIYQDIAGNFQLYLANETGAPVKIHAGAGDDAKKSIAVDTYFEWHFKDQATGKRIVKIDGKDPVPWIADNILKPMMFSTGLRCLGCRMNDFLTDYANPVGMKFNVLAEIDHLNLKSGFRVEFADGVSSTWSWRSYFSWAPKDPSPSRWTPEGCVDTQCLIDRMTDAINNFKNPLLATSEFLGTIIERQLQLESPEQALEGVRAANGPRQAHPAQSQPAQRSSAPDPALSKVPFDDGISFKERGFLAFDRDEDGKEYAIFKLNTFTLPAIGDKEVGMAVSQFLEQWLNFTITAKAKGVTRLVIDLVGNGGGLILYAYGALRAFFPHLSVQGICNYYDTVQGQAAKAFREIDIEVVTAAVKNDTLVQERWKHLLLDLTYTFKLFKNTRALVKAALDLGVLSEKEAAALGKILESLLMNPTPSGIKEMLNAFLAAIPGQDVYCPFGAFDPDTLEKFNRTNSNLERELRRAGKRHSFTKQFYTGECHTIFDPKMVPGLDVLKSVKVPFTSIRIISSGNCGSSCDTFSRSFYFAAKAANLDVAFVTYGGLGGPVEEQKRFLTATQFSGGSAMMNAEAGMYQDIKKQLIISYVLAFWLGMEGLTKQLVNYDRQVPVYPVFMNDEGVPAFTQNEIYYRALGKESFPGEFLFFPTDFTLNDFFYNVIKTPWDISELKRLYHASVKSMPRTLE